MAYLATNTFPGTGTVMQVAISFAGNRPDASSGTVAYFDPANVKAESVWPATPNTNEVVTPVALTQVNASTFRTSVVIPQGAFLRVYRETLVAYPMVDFADRQTVTENDLDTSSRQVLYAAMEALDRSNRAIESARQSLTFAITAVNTSNAATAQANSAVAAANNAVGVANNANTNSAAAVRSANAAVASSDAALQVARSADAHAANVEALAAAANNASVNAVNTAAQAKAAADSVDGKASTALSQSTNAVEVANQASSTARGVDAKAEYAVNVANDSSAKAASAKATAEGIDAKAQYAVNTAEVANNNAASAKTTADGLSAAVNKAQADATTAYNSAISADRNADRRVSKAGDTMTGPLEATAFTVGDLYLSASGLGQQNAGRISISGGGINGAGLAAMSLYSNGVVYYNAKDALGNARGSLSNQVEGHWNIQAASGKNWTFANDGVSYFPDAIRIAQGASVFSAITSGRNANASGPELVSTAVPTISGGTSAHYAAAALKITNGGNNSASAAIILHREGSHACFFGLDTDNELAYGGYSYGAVRYRLWSERNFNPADYIRYDNLRQELGGRGAGDVGTYAFLWCVGNYDPGTLVGGGSLNWGSFNDKGGVVGGGTWRCMGYGRGDKATLWLRVN